MQLDQIFANNRNPDCVSDLLLDRLEHGELDQQERVSVKEHVAACSICETRLADRNLSFDKLSDDSRREMVEQIHLAVVQQTQEAPASKSWLRAWIPGFVALAACALAVAFVPREGTRAKGDLYLVVHRERGGVVSDLVNGEEVQPNDRLRFSVRVPEGSYVMVVGEEADGDAYPCTQPERVAHGEGLLADTIRLDDSVGDERLVLISCNRAFTESDAISGGRLSVPDGCRSTPFEIKKVRR